MTFVLFYFKKYFYRFQGEGCSLHPALPAPTPQTGDGAGKGLCVEHRLCGVGVAAGRSVRSLWRLVFCVHLTGPGDAETAGRISERGCEGVPAEMNL